MLKSEVEQFFLSKNNTEHLHIHVAIDYIKKIFSYIDTYFSQVYSNVVMCDCVPEKKFKDVIYLKNNIDNPEQIEINYFNFTANFWDSLRKNKNDFKNQGIQLEQAKESTNKDDIEKIILICGCISPSQIIDDTTLKEIFSCVEALSATKKSSMKRDYTLQTIIEFLECKEEFELLSAAETEETSNNDEHSIKIQYLYNKLKVNFFYLLKIFFSLTESYRPGALLGMFVFDTIKIFLLCNIELSGDPLEICEERNIIYANWIIKNKHVHRDPKQSSLLLSVQNNDDEMIEFLIRKQKELKVNINVKNENGDTALSLGLKYGHFKIVDLLIRARIDVNTKNNEGGRFNLLCCRLWLC